MKLGRSGRSGFVVRDLPKVTSFMVTSHHQHVSPSGRKSWDAIVTVSVDCENPEIWEKKKRKMDRWLAKMELRRAQRLREWREALIENGHAPGPDHPAYLPPGREGAG